MKTSTVITVCVILSMFLGFFVMNAVATFRFNGKLVALQNYKDYLNDEECIKMGLTDPDQKYYIKAKRIRTINLGYFQLPQVVDSVFEMSTYSERREF